MTVSIALSPEIEKRIEAISLRMGRSKTVQLEELVEKGLEDLEDYYFAMDVRDRFRAGDEGVTCLDSLERELGLAG